MLRSFLTLVFLFVIWSNGAKGNKLPSNAPTAEVSSGMTSNAPSSGNVEIYSMFFACPPWGFFSGDPVEGKCYAEVSSGRGEVWTNGCSEINLRRSYFNTKARSDVDVDVDAALYDEPEYDNQIYHTIAVSLVFGCSGSEVGLPYEAREDMCEVKVGEDICNECSLDSEGKLTVVDCSNAAEDIFSYLPQTVDPISSGSIWFDVDIETEEMCNHPSVTGINSAQQPRLTPPSEAPSATTITEGLGEGPASTASSVERTSSGTITHSIQTELQYTFFPGKGNQPKEAAIAGLINETLDFFDAAFLERPTFSRGALKDIVFKHIAHSYTSGDVFDLTFTADIIVENSLTFVSNREVADVIAHSDLNKYVGHYVRNSRRDDDHVFQQVYKVKFRGVSKA